jgi:hypothetical protein
VYEWKSTTTQGGTREQQCLGTARYRGEVMGNPLHKLDLHFVSPFGGSGVLLGLKPSGPASLKTKARFPSSSFLLHRINHSCSGGSCGNSV